VQFRAFFDPLGGRGYNDRTDGEGTLIVKRTGILVLPLLLSVVVVAGEPIPDGAVEFGGHHYLLVDGVEDLSWDGARARCSALGGTLAVVTSEAEASFIAELCDGRYMYLGATDNESEGEWTWVDGTPWDFTHWMSGQPNDYGGTEDYLATYDEGRWVDVAGAGDGFWMPTGFICEWKR
jgi:hypothetical protein